MRRPVLWGDGPSSSDDSDRMPPSLTSRSPVAPSSSSSSSLRASASISISLRRLRHRLPRSARACPAVTSGAEVPPVASAWNGVGSTCERDRHCTRGDGSRSPSGSSASAKKRTRKGLSPLDTAMSSARQCRGGSPTA
eukprot:scaffold13210_cov109-Isochrysis_galbana.AAC.9